MDSIGAEEEVRRVYQNTHGGGILIQQHPAVIEISCLHIHLTRNSTGVPAVYDPTHDGRYAISTPIPHP